MNATVPPTDGPEGPPETPDDEVLAGEYALGVLKADERAAAEQRILEEPAFAARVAAWNERLAPLADAIPSVAPPASLRQRLEGELFGREGTDGERTAAPSGLWASLAFWRGATLAASLAAVLAVAAALDLVPGWRPEQQPERPGPLVAALQAEGAEPLFLARLDGESGRLVIRASAPEEPEARVPELWLIPEDGQARSLGVIAQEGETEVAIPPELRALARPDSTLAITLEPPGGAPGGVATGPLIAIGSLREL